MRKKKLKEILKKYLLGNFAAGLGNSFFSQHTPRLVQSIPVTEVEESNANVMKTRTNVAGNVMGRNGNSELRYNTVDKKLIVEKN